MKEKIKFTKSSNKNKNHRQINGKNHMKLNNGYVGEIHNIRNTRSAYLATARTKHIYQTENVHNKVTARTSAVGQDDCGQDLLLIAVSIL